MPRNTTNKKTLEILRCAQILRCFKSEYLSFFSACRVFRHAGLDVTIPPLNKCNSGSTEHRHSTIQNSPAKRAHYYIYLGIVQYLPSWPLSNAGRSDMPEYDYGNSQRGPSGSGHLRSADSSGSLTCADLAMPWSPPSYHDPQR